MSVHRHQSYQSFQSRQEHEQPRSCRGYEKLQLCEDRHQSEHPLMRQT